MGKIPNEFTQTTPDSTLKSLAFKGKNGTGGLARFAHLNKVRDAIVLDDYADEAAALDAGLVAGDLYRIGPDVKVVE